MTALRCLDIDGVYVTDKMPPGEYLTHLTSLSMRNCSFLVGLPANVTDASELCYLDIGPSRYSRGVQLAADDLAVLSSLPALTGLGVTKPLRVEWDVWNGRMAQLKAEYMEMGRSLTVWDLDATDSSDGGSYNSENMEDMDQWDGYWY